MQEVAPDAAHPWYTSRGFAPGRSSTSQPGSRRMRGMTSLTAPSILGSCPPCENTVGTPASRTHSAGRMTSSAITRHRSNASSAARLIGRTVGGTMIKRLLAAVGRLDGPARLHVVGAGRAARLAGVAEQLVLSITRDGQQAPRLAPAEAGTDRGRSGRPVSRSSGIAPFPRGSP